MPSPAAPAPPISGPRVVAQAAYRGTPAASVTAAALVARKCRNCASLLKKFLLYQRRYPERARRLESAIRTLERAAEQLSIQPPRAPALFLAEAHAARAYWAGVGTLIAQHDLSWTRRYPHARDPVNLLLNTGYTFLAQWVGEVIRAAGLLPEIGIFHATAGGKEPPVYDLMELFRQPAIDAVVIPLFTKKKRPTRAITQRDVRRAVAKFHEQWERPFWYRGRCLPLRGIAEAEVVSLVRAMARGVAWEPYRHPWGHRWTCVHYRIAPEDKKKRLRVEAAE